MTLRFPYKGSFRKLVLAFDIGTTYSGISYSILDPGQPVEIKGVTRFPGQEQINGASKIPTVINYDREGKVQAVGAEAVSEGILETVLNEKWIKAEWFKLHLRNKLGGTRDITDDIPPLPLNKTIVDVFADFLKYLLCCAEAYIKDTHANGVALWNSVKNEIDFVLSHPNGWEGAQQAKMKEAAFLAGLVPNTSAGQLRLSFVTEGEASLYFSIQNGLPRNVLREKHGIIIVDAGGGTIDISSYAKGSQDNSDSFEEIAIPQCHFHGSVFVTIHARIFLQNLLSGSEFVDDIDHVVRCFDKSTKLRFRDSGKPEYIKFGGIRDNDAEHNIKFGQVRLLGTDIANFFQPSVECIVSAVLDQQKTAKQNITHVILVGGFAASDWLLSQVQKQLSGTSLCIFRPENHLNKAVSDGALSFYLNHFVRTRISKFDYGPIATISFNPNSPNHQQRSADTFIDWDGTKSLRGYFWIALARNTQISETQEYRGRFCDVYAANSDRKTNIAISCYRGSMAPTPEWFDIDPQNFTVVGTFVADFSGVPLKSRKRKDGVSGKYYEVHYDIVVFFGLTELKAQVEWQENGITKRSPAEIIYEPET